MRRGRWSHFFFQQIDYPGSYMSTKCGHGAPGAHLEGAQRAALLLHVTEGASCSPIPLHQLCQEPGRACLQSHNNFQGAIFSSQSKEACRGPRTENDKARVERPPPQVSTWGTQASTPALAPSGPASVPAGPQSWGGCSRGPRDPCLPWRRKLGPGHTLR